MTREQKIAKARELSAAGVQQSVIASRLGVVPSTVWRWLHPEEHRQRELARNGYKRQWERDNRAACPNCGTPMAAGSRSASKRPELCRDCHLEDQLENSTTAEIARAWSEGKTTRQIATQIKRSPDFVSRMIARIRHEDEGKAYRERYGFPVHRRTSEQVKRIHDATVVAVARRKAA